MSYTILDIDDAEIQGITGPMNHDDLNMIRVVLKTIKERYYIGPNNGLTHGENCWMWGPAHYGCALKKIGEQLNAKASPSK